MKERGICLSGSKLTDPVERAKSKLYASYQKKKERQREEHILEKKMAHHIIPNLFVSRRRDRNPNGFNCAICHKDISFLSRGEIEIWRHAVCKSHYLRDRRYRFEYEDVIYSPTFELIPVSTISAELRDEILLTPPVTLGKRYPFIEDEIDSIVGVPSNIPPSTLVGCLFELLRSGGSQSLLRRLWMQFRTTLPVDSVYAQSTWSKTETFVVLTQTLYPRVLRRVKAWAKDHPFSISLRSDVEKVLCAVHFCIDGQLRTVVLLWEPHVADLCGAELSCLSRVFAILPAGKGPVAIRGCSATLYNSLLEWCKSKELSVPFSSVDFQDDTLIESIREADRVTGNLCPIVVVDLLVQFLCPSVQQPWLLEMPVFRRCLLVKRVSFRQLVEVIPELVAHWNDVILFLNSDALFRSSGVAESLLGSPDTCLASLCYLQIVLLCYQANMPSLFDADIVDRSCRSYSEFCFFYWSLLSKVKRLADLPAIDSWSEYVNKPLTAWGNVPAVDCFRSESIVIAACRNLADSAVRGFLKDCHSAYMELLKIVGNCCFIRSQLSSSLSCLTADMLITGDDIYGVELFQQLVGSLRDAGLLTEVEKEAAVNEFRSFIVDVRRRNQKPVKSIKDCLSFIRSFGFFSCRENFVRVINLVSVIVDPCEGEYPSVDISFSGIRLPEKIFHSSVVAVQSLVLTPSFSSGDLLTKTCLEELKVNLPNGKQFLESEVFRPWDDVYEQPRATVFAEMKDCFLSYFQGQVADWRNKIAASSSKSSPSAKRGTSTPRKSGSHVSHTALPPTISPIVGSASGSRSGVGVSPTAKTPLPPVTDVLPTVASKFSDVLRSKRREREQAVELSVAGPPSNSGAKKGRFVKPSSK